MAEDHGNEQDLVLDEDAGPNLRRRHLGRVLREIRQGQGKSLKEAATWSGLREGTISKMENGKQAIMPRNVRLLCQYYDVGSPRADLLVRLADEANQRGWWDFYSDTMPEWFEQFVGLESDATELWNYNPSVVDGLLQTSDYAEALIEASLPQSTDADLRRSVELRAARQSRLNRDSHPTHLHVVLDEAVLHRVVGSTNVMRDQLEHLTEAASRPNITIQIMPFRAGAHPAMKGPFSLLRFPETLDMDAVYLENERGAIWLERPADITHYTTVFKAMRQQALSPEETLDQVVNLAKSL
ncbi:Helix-turn-helix domain-containing protein [Saccharopolyspora antimicrobica]|uniref:Helix-turn-helix domain-containing protein n=1 Tax=Saccharopolyspora antimicrobica TaxID=455193 RepID=A0A1I4YKT4_9PSEU|nr:Scr1 family TA system antitoxin-like transcriptional regulator [Saccharopolyspora antimicrobica]RKT82701.1 helix-turn-helix protein [Saccharopolyspora antimicrobica]SFN38159.1 Helix-turn-helix domain-containing protein [Saccharopolyspora antimicrobica]